MIAPKYSEIYAHGMIQSHIDITWQMPPPNEICLHCLSIPTTQRRRTKQHRPDHDWTPQQIQPPFIIGLPLLFGRCRVRLRSVQEYRAGLKSGPQVARICQASWGRGGIKNWNKIHQTWGPPFYPIPVVQSCGRMPKWTLTPKLSDIGILWIDYLIMQARN